MDDPLVDIPLERTILGRLLCAHAPQSDRTESLIRVSRAVVAGMFSRAAHQLIFAEIIDAGFESGEPPDWAVVERRLRDKGPSVWTESSDDYLRGLAEAEPYSFVPDGLSQRLTDLSKRRKLLRKARDLIEMVSNPTGTLADAIDYADGLTARLEAEGSDQELLGKIRTTAELFGDAKPPNFGVRNFYTAGSLIVWAAPEKAWKTTLAVHLAIVSTGHGKFLGQYEAVQTGPVLIFSGESGDWPITSMIRRILEYTYPGETIDFDGNRVSLLPDPAQIPIFWAGDPPDLGNPAATAALKRRVVDLGAKLLILDPSQALFASISDDMKSDAAMRQYLKRLQTLARETGCCVLLLHHFRQHVPAGFPKRSDSSYGGLMKFTDGWILANLREAPTGDEEPGSGSLWLTWGHRDGFGGSLALDIREGTHPDRFFDVQVTDTKIAMARLAESQAERKGEATKAIRSAANDQRRKAIRDALAGRDTGVSRAMLAGLTGVGRTALAPTVDAMLSGGELAEVPAEYVNHGKLCWATGLALREAAEKIISKAASRGWRDPKNGTGVTPVTGVASATPTPVGAGGGPPVCRPPLKGATTEGGLTTPQSGSESESNSDTRHPLGGAA